MTTKEVLAGHPFASGVSDAQLDALSTCARLMRVAAGGVIFKEGADATGLYLIIEGRVSLEQHVPGRGGVQLENLGRGDLLGLSWLVPGGRWLLDARATEPSDLLVLDARCVQARMAADCDLALLVSRHVIQQLYQRLERVRLQRLDVYRADQ